MSVVKGRLGELLKVVAATLVVLVLAEVLIRVVYGIRNSMVDAIPLPYDAGQGFAAIPPWIDGLRILEKDESLLWRNRPNVTRKYVDVYGPVQREDERRSLPIRFLPILPASLRGKPMWEISINSEGYRDVEWPSGKAASVYRIVCLGDSWTFGANVGQDQAYPQRLHVLLASEYPRANFEVFNLGVLGYSSFQGRRLLPRALERFDPDLVTIAFAMNDAVVSGWRDKDVVEEGKTTARRLRRLLERSEVFELLLHVAKTVNAEPPLEIGDHLQKFASAEGTLAAAWAGRWASETADYEELEPYTRVSPDDYEENILRMIDRIRGHGVDAVLIFNELWNTPHRRILQRISNEEQVSLVDSKARIDQARARIVSEFEQRLGLRPAAFRAVAEREGVQVVFRVYSGVHPVPQALFIAGTHPQLGNGEPNRVAMYDDGTHGDQKPGDQVWSYTASLEPGSVVFYVYTNSGTPGLWEGLDVPDVRRFRVEASPGERVYLPMDTFGEMYMQADVAHTNAHGYDLIARDLLAVLKENEGVRAYLARVGHVP